MVQMYETYLDIEDYLKYKMSRKIGFSSGESTSRRNSEENFGRNKFYITNI